MQVFRSDLLALARKYRALTEFRRSLEQPAASLLRALAREFPGALRELECLPLDSLDARLDQATRAASGATPEEWVLWMISYHRRMRLMLAVKRWLGQASEPPDSVAIARRVWFELREPCDAVLVDRVRQPPAGRLNRLVFELLEVEFGRSSAELERTLFPELSRTRAEQQGRGL